QRLTGALAYDEDDETKHTVEHILALTEHGNNNNPHYNVTPLDKQTVIEKQAEISMWRQMDFVNMLAALMGNYQMGAGRAAARGAPNPGSSAAGATSTLVQLQAEALWASLLPV
ncbi:unnamed protein product, partial [Amoebophrya sp. A120]